MAFPTLGAQQETNRKILEDLQLKRQLLQKGVNPVSDINLNTGLSTPLNQMPTTQLLGQPTDFPQTCSAITVPRSVFNPTSATTLGYFISQDSHYGNSFIPVLPSVNISIMARMRMKKLEEYLSGVDDFDKPKIKLEQYSTPPHIASCILYNIQAEFEDLEGKLVGDLGSGCGMLSIGAFLLGAQLIVGFELDADAIDIFRTNVCEMELPAIDCIQTNVLQLSATKWDNCFETIVTNPPFGTKNNSGMDMRFIETGIKLATRAVYSLHKTTTRDYILKKAKDWNVKGQVVAELKYNIDASYKFHKNKSVDIEVDFWRFDVTDKEI